MIRIPAWALAFCILSSTASAVDLVKDINTNTQPRSSLPQELFRSPAPVAIAGGSLLVMNDGSHGDELWITDGTPNGTRMVRDIKPGAASSGIERFVLMGGVAYFAADDGVNGFELWRSDGTPVGTRIVANIGAENLFLPPSSLTVVGSVLYFAATDAQGQELWRSDGTAAGTYRVKDINPGGASADISQIVASGSQIYFGASSESGFEPWTSDGTEQGTVRIADVNPGILGSGAYFLAVGNGTVFFTADDGVHGRELWRVAAGNRSASMVADINLATDGAGANTRGSDPQMFAVGSSVIVLAKSGALSTETRSLYAAGAAGGVTLLTALPADAEINTFINVGERAIFRVDTQATNHPWWVTDGTLSGTVRVPALERPPGGETDVTFGGGAAFFNVWADNASSSEIWRTDGTLVGTTKYADILDQRYSSDIQFFNGRVFFVNDYPLQTGTRELWVSDGTPAGTGLFADLLPGNEGSSPVLMGTAGGKLLFFARDLTTGFEPWSSDGTLAGTQVLGNFAPEVATAASYPVLLGDTAAGVLIAADDGIHGSELWISDGSPSGTRLLQDVYPGQFGSEISNASLLGGLVLFGAQDVGGGRELWRSDGTLAGTFRLSDIQPGATSGIPLENLSTATLGGDLYFVASDPSHYRALWRTDGSVAGTVPAADIPPLSSFETIEILGSSSTRVLLRRQSGQSPGTVWSTTGDPSSAVEVAADVFVDTTWAVPFKGKLCFPARQTGTSEIWCSSGAAGDMQRITDLASANLQVLGVPQVVNDTLLVMATGVGQPFALVATDGDAASTRVISSSMMANVPGVPFGGGLVYVTVTGNDWTLTFTDGTAAGTRPFIPPGVSLPGVLRQAAPVQFGGAILFLVQDPQAGPVIWRSDGTVSGTRYLADVDPGPDGSTGPEGFTIHGGKLLFSAPRLGIGQELWALSALGPNAADDAGTTAFGNRISVNVLANDADFDGNLNPGTVQIVTAPASGTTTIDSGTGAIGYTPNAGFSGADQLTYRVADNSGNYSNVAYVYLVVGNPAGSAPAPGPQPTPLPTPPPEPVPTGSSGGGGALGIEILLLLALVAALGMRRWHHMRQT